MDSSHHMVGFPMAKPGQGWVNAPSNIRALLISVLDESTPDARRCPQLGLYHTNTSIIDILSTEATVTSNA